MKDDVEPSQQNDGASSKDHQQHQKQTPQCRVATQRAGTLITRCEVSLTFLVPVSSNHSASLRRLIIIGHYFSTTTSYQ